MSITSSTPCVPPEAPRAVLFDLDGTFADTAPDLAAALNRLRAEQGLPGIDPLHLRPYTSQGARGMLGAGMGIDAGDPRYPDLRRRFLDYYAEGLCVETTVFPGIRELTARLDASAVPWGIVTNKPHRFTLPLMRALGADHRAGCIVSGDTSPRAKPFAEPLFLAAALLGLDPQHCAYVGDDRRDIVAGRQAGMTTIAVRYGYPGDHPPFEEWRADHVIGVPLEIAELFGL